MMGDSKNKENLILFYERGFYVFSNFSSFAVDWRGKVRMTSEHAYQVARFDDEDIINEIFQARSAHDSKKLAQKYKEQQFKNWDEIKVSIMKEIVRAKLQQHAYIQKLLKKTEDRDIIEDSPKDEFWGWGPNKDGRNELGKIWMELREEQNRA